MNTLYLLPLGILSMLALIWWAVQPNKESER